jgi:poly-gamma-glutamate synthesis protein (capsule biosynthesis protein)
MNKITIAFLTLLILLFLAAGCAQSGPNAGQLAVAPDVLPSATTSPTLEPTQKLPTPTLIPSPTPLPALKLWMDPLLPEKDRQRAAALGQLVKTPTEANVRLGLGTDKTPIGQWIFALVAPFPTLTDEIDLNALRTAWQGGQAPTMAGHVILVDPAVRQAVERAWGPGANGAVRSVDAAGLLETAWREKTSWAIIPFETIQPRWKVLRLDGRSPLDKSFDPAAYGLTLPVSIGGEDWAVSQFRQKLPDLFSAMLTNRDPKRLTVLVMTGVTALVRGTAWYMEQKNDMLYPGKDIRNWLREADITHVSNEIAFNPKCPYPIPNDPNLRFCSSPKYIQLLEDVGVDVVEMSGNHMNDFGSEWVKYTIDMYDQRHWLHYAAGVNKDEARKPAVIEHNGNRIAFLGCDPAGPKPNWATASQPGAADCGYPDMDTFEADIRRMVKEGYLPVVTMQYFESYDPRPLPIHYRDFRRMLDAGAVIVSGSQAHLPQAMELRGNGFIHYGLGNLFFDQMDTFWPATKDEFIDRHVFYDGKYFGVELLTAQLEDYVKPRPMTAPERQTLLQRIFEVSGWSQIYPTEWK